MSVSKASGTPCGSVFGRFMALSYAPIDDEGEMKVNYLSLCYRGSDNPGFILFSEACVLVYHLMACMETDISRKNNENRPKSKDRRCRIKFATEWASRKLLGCPVARYSDVSVFYCRMPSVQNGVEWQDRHYKIKFATEWASRELLGRPVARYSDVFVFQMIFRCSLNGSRRWYVCGF